MQLIRNVFPKQGAMWASHKWSLFPPGYIIHYGPPKGDVPLKTWEAWDLRLSQETHKFATLEDALAFLSKAFGEEITLKSAEEREQRHKEKP